MQDNLWLPSMQPVTQATQRLICFPFAGGFAEYFLPWQSRLAPYIQIAPIQLPGRSYRFQETAITHIEQLFSRMLPAIKNLLYEKPYIIFGHSMGGYIAYQFCKLLMSNQLPLPQYLLLSSLPAPKYWIHHKRLSELSHQAFNTFFCNLGGLHPEFQQHKTFMNMQMLLLRNDIMLCESCSYTYPAQFPFPIIALGGLEDGYVPLASMNDWCLETKSGFKQHAFSGGHFYLNQHLSAVIDCIQKGLT